MEKLRPMANKKSPRYEVDDTTRQLLETVLNITAQSAQLQIAEEMAEALFNITDTLAERFNIETRIYQIEDEDDEEPRSITLIDHNQLVDPSTLISP